MLEVKSYLPTYPLMLFGAALKKRASFTIFYY
jgi:hypothetical protein